ncbi:putative leucine-rich repeat receptor-like protein kinase IMK3 [Panicum miliaceum]|uniref:Leucine-rich repeat receptor-like protein kinase IMK3 n=1 Tax=Panicum miliaceum TaxID=4540 RepID=A0A3L6RDC3_PANMI|nr:putative leucine-rich repeat receptor-like protein kinase IMK3 [Panicum miliaceum]
MLLLFLLLLLLAPPANAKGHHPAGDGVVISQADYQGLQAIRHDLADPYGFLRSWNDSGLTACSGAWAGIKCVLGGVVAITLPWRGLGGTLSQRGLGQLTRLRRLSLHDNAIAGPIPASLGFLPDLRGVYLFNNRFSGAVPASIGGCLALQSFDASNNRLTGAIPPAVANSTKLIRLNLSRNAFSDEIPAEVVASASLLVLDLSYNNLSGPIPDAFAPSNLLNKESITGTCQLVFLSLAHNSLDGPIPESLAKLTKLQDLDLSGNNLNGTIPAELGNLTATLHSFNVSYNNLSGAVPPSLARKFGEPAFTGNILLCGYSASTPCPASPSPAPSAPASPAEESRGRRKFSTKELTLIIAGIVVGVLILLLLCCLLLCFLTRKRSSSGTAAGARSGKQQAAKDAAGAGAAAAGRGEKPGSGAAEVESGGDVGGKLVHFDGPLAFTADDLLAGCQRAPPAASSPPAAAPRSAPPCGSSPSPTPSPRPTTAHPLLFILVSPSASPSFSTHSYDYRAFLLLASRLVPASLTVVNVGPGFRDTNTTPSPQSLPCPACHPRLRPQAAEMDDMYAGMLRKLEKLAREVENSNIRVLEQENRNLLLRFRCAGME